MPTGRPGATGSPGPTLPWGGRLRPYRLAEPASYACSRCGTVMRSRRLTVIDGDWLRLLCPPCTTVLAPAYEQASKR